MKKCNECDKSLFDFEEHKYGLCWDCMSKNPDIIESNPDVGEITQEETSQEAKSDEKFSVVIRDREGTTLRLGGKKKKAGTAKLSDDKPVKTQKKKAKTSTVKDENTEVPPDDKNSETGSGSGEQKGGKDQGQEKEDKTKATTTKGNGRNNPVDNEDELKVVRESKEVLTKSGRAKLRAFALINQAIKETGTFDVSATLNGQRKTVSSAPVDASNIEDILMTTSMEVTDDTLTPGKKKK